MTDRSSGAGAPPRVSEAELAGLLRRSGVNPPPDEIRAMIPSAARFQEMIDRVNSPLPRTTEPVSTFAVGEE